jgi:dienelactone hydrolase
MSAIGRREFVRMTTGAAASAIAPSGRAQSRAQRGVPKSEFDYVDWSWERWRDLTRATRTTVRTEQSGRGELVPLLPASGASRVRWSADRAAIVRTLEFALGREPTSVVPLQPERIETTPRDGFDLGRVRYRARTGEWIPALLLVPRPRQPKMPAILCPHQTTQAGRREPAGLAGDPRLHTALHLVQRGYVTLTWDALCFGERHDPGSGHYGDAIPFYTAHADWSLLAKMASDASRGIDYLQTLPFVDASRIGSVGHSHGGITTIVTMALDERVAAGASNCGFDTFRIDGNVWRWSHATALLPALGFFAGSPYLSMDRYRAVPDSEVIQTPFDMHQVLALAAPRPLWLSTSDEDFVFPNAGWSARQTLARLAPVYELLGRGDALASRFFAGGHAFPTEISSAAYAWLDRWLK